MSKKFRSQASSARAASTFTSGFGSGSTFQTSSSPLSYVAESPDLSQISEPNIVVAFKNLAKKDSTTKAKALEDLQENIGNDVEQSVLSAWADIFPRTSIDNSRRVRQLAHTLQGSLTVSAGKRIAPLLSKVIASWLAGTFDADKTVSKSAQEALEKSFATPEKRKALWSLYKNGLFEYIEDAIMVQSASTLSDERTTSADDAEAKYVRVVGTSMNLLAQLLREKTYNDTVTTLLSGKKLWELVSHNDPYLRRTVCELVIIASENYSNELNWKVVSTCFLSKGLHANQSGSSRQYTTALLTLTQHRPLLWIDDYTAKTSVSKRLMQFLRHGSHNGPEDVWSNISRLIKSIPEKVWTNENQFESASNLAEALKTGVTQPTERVNALAAWTTYVQICLWLASKIKDEQHEFISQHLAPIVLQYVSKQQDSQWNITTRAQQICIGILVGGIKLGVISTVESIWKELADMTIDNMKLSQPVTSKDFRSSQDAVIDRARRLFDIKSGVMKTEEASSMQSLFQQSDDKILNSAIELLKSRNGKPYGASGVIELIVNQNGYEKGNSTLQDFLKNDMQSLLNSPSAGRLTSIALTCGQAGIVDNLLSQRSTESDEALCHALSFVKKTQLSRESYTRLSKVDIRSTSDHALVMAVMRNPALIELHATFCDQLQEATSVQAVADAKHSALVLLQKLLAESRTAESLLADQTRATLLPNLLLMVDAGGDNSELAQSVVSKMKNKTRSGAGSVSIIQQQLNGEGTPLAMYTLIELAKDVVSASGSDVGAILPTDKNWMKALQPHLHSRRPYSLAITSSLQGLLYAINDTGYRNEAESARDQDDFSLAFRLTIYVTKLLSASNAIFEGQQLQTLYPYYPLALQLVNECMTVDGANGLWIHSTYEVLEEASEILSEGHVLILSWLKDENFQSYWLKLAHELTESDLPSYTKALAWNSIATQYVDQFGPAKLMHEYDEDLKTIHKSNAILRSVALLSVLRDNLASTSYAKRVLNELIVDATELKGQTLKPLILLNILLLGDSESLEQVPTQRIVFLLKNLVRLLGERSTAGMQAEVMKLLTIITTHIQDIYGEHWEQILANISELWSSETDLHTIHSSVRLYSKLKNLSEDGDVNEDLQDAFRNAKHGLDTGLVQCLQQLSRGAHNPDLPRSITAELVRRQLRDVEVKGTESLFSLLTSSVEAVRNAAFEVLHRTIPKQQEQLSVELILNKQIVQLPQELMTILADEQTSSTVYMLAWKLVFDHFSEASFMLRESYSAEIKESAQIDRLLTHSSDALRIVSGRPVDASKFDISNYDIGQVESMEQGLLWLVVHNYYNTLLYVPSLAKDWFISQKNRVKSPLEVWTQKHISPLIVAASLSTVTEWASTQTQDEDDRPLVIKSSPRGSELTATIAVDPESPPISIAISLPGSYPLESPVVTSRTRVGVSEKNWQSWLRTIQIIIFSTGSIIEGLIAFRRNVQGALKGQNECAICYSIIGTDMQTPNKKCGTCKNNFHGTCLFRWFKSSNSSSCPLCRNNFNYA